MNELTQLPPSGTWFLNAALAGYAISMAWAWLLAAKGQSNYKSALTLLAASLGLHALSILIIWYHLGHGPYMNLQESLNGNVATATALLVGLCWAMPRIRPILPFAFGVIFIFVIWLALLEAKATILPVTYFTLWLEVHLWLGKIFLASIIFAAGLSAAVIWRHFLGRERLPALPGNDSLAELTFRVMAVGFIFHSLMLTAGAVWAQDAWGRYWAWDPLETWAFMTWVSLIFYLHLRITKKITPLVGAAVVWISFAIAVLTFFGVPFLSHVSHQGAV